MTKISRSMLFMITLFIAGAAVMTTSADAQHRRHHRHHHHYHGR